VSGWARLITRVYRVLLALYPPTFRADFGEEMQDVFAAGLAETQRPGGETLRRLLWREVRDWPQAVLQQHLRARRTKMPVNGLDVERPLPRSELLAAMVIFVLPLFGVVAATSLRLSQWMDYGALALCWGTVLFALGLAIARRLPRWSLSYLGFALMLGIVLGPIDRVWSWLYPIFLRAYGPRSGWSVPVRIVYVGIAELILLGTLLVSALILVNLLRVWPSTRRVWQGIRADWTHLSFLFYGGLVFSILLAFDEYRYDESWKFVAWFWLAVAAWWYLRTKGQRRRILALICGATAAMWTVALAKWVLIPLQEWPTGYPIAPSETSRWVETGSAVSGWVCILLMLIAPALLNLQTRASRPSDTQTEDAASM
jgi:hypothetical protein